MRALVRNQRAHLVPVELLTHDMKTGLVSYPTDKSSLFPPKRVTLGVYNVGERRAPAPEGVLRHLASCLDMPRISAHLAAAADGETTETKAEDIDMDSFFSADPVATIADDTAPDLPPGLRQVATLISTEQLTTHLEGLDRPALENLVKLDWGYSFSRDLTDLDDSDVVTLLLGIVADARTRHMSLLYAARSSSAASVPADPTSTSEDAHDGGEDVTLHIDESRRQASKAPWLNLKSPVLTLASLSPAGISAVRAVLMQDLLLGHVVSRAVDDFKTRHPGHPMTAELINAIKGSNDDRYLRAVASYKPGAFDRAYQVVPTGLMSAWALLYCFNASDGGDRTDLLSKISDIRVTTTHNISSLDDVAIKISDIRTACIDLGLDELTNKELATAICKAADASPSAWQATPQAKHLLAARDVLDGSLDKGVAPTDEVYKAVVDAVFEGRTLAVRARSRLPTAPPADAAQVLALTDDAGAGGGGSNGGGGGGKRGDDDVRDRNRDRGRDRGRGRGRGRNDDGSDRGRGADRGRDGADRGRGAAADDRIPMSERRCRALLSTWLQRFTCFSRALRVPFVFVGVMPVDEPVVLLEPPKHDWDSFHDLHLTQVMSIVEHELESKFADLRFLHPSLLANACPGARCDGVHYGSQFDSGAADYGCHATPALWCPLLSQFVRCRLPSLLAGDVHAHRAYSSMPMTTPETLSRTHQLHQCLRRHARFAAH